MKGSKIMALAIVGIMIASGLVILAPSSVKAFPTHTPQSSEYYFNDNFERTGIIGWPYWLSNQVYYPTFSTVQQFAGAKSLKFAPTSNSLQILRYFSNNTPNVNEGVMIETQFFDNASDVDVQASMFLYNAAGSWVSLGVRNETSQRMFVYWVSDGGGTYKYQGTGVERTSAWHDLKILIKSHTQYSFYIDNNFVGNITLADSTGMLGYGFTDTNTHPLTCYIDQFIVYPFYQDQLWTRHGMAINDNKTWKSYLAIEPSLLYESGVWKMWYDVVNVSNTAIGGLGYSTSTDGYNWTDYAINPLVSFGVGYRPFVTKIDSTYYLYSTYEAGLYAAKHYVLRTSANGISWSAPTDTNLGCGAVEGSWDHKLLGNIDVWREGATWYALYEAASNSTLWRLGLATSSDGITWTKNPANPVSPTGMVAGGPDIHKYGSTYYLLCHGVQTDWVDNKPTDIYLLQSTDLVTWTQNIFFGQFVRLFGFFGERPQVADASYFSAQGKNLIAYEGTVNGTDEGRIYIARSTYTLQQIAEGQVLQSGNHLIGNLGVKNNVTAAGKYWYSGINAMKGTYTDNLSLTTTSPINITLTAMGNLTTAWTADSGIGNPNVHYRVSNLTAGNTYYIRIDGALYASEQAPANGSISLIYSGGNHQFEVTLYRYGATLSPLLYLIPFILTLGVVMIPIVKIMEISKRKRMLRVDEVIRMFVTIVVGMALVGITYAMI